jgi:hypothetical protein
VALAGVGVGPIGKTITIGKVDLYRKIRVCAIPDTQNQIGDSGNLSIFQNDPNSCILTPPGQGSFTSQCFGEWCNHPRWCGSTWKDTGRVMWQNQARVLTGQYDKVNWENITGGDTRPRNNWPDNHGAMACDVIISLGDINSYADDSTKYTKAGSTPLQLLSYNASVAMWKIIADSNIPSIIDRGNHDPNDIIANLWADSGLSGKSYVRAIESTSHVAASVLVPMTNAGKPLCIITTNSLGAVAGDTQSATETIFDKNQSGCGGSYPTILVGHEMVSPNAVYATDPTSATDCSVQPVTGTGILAVPGETNIFMVLGGHFLNAPSCTEFVPAGTAGGNVSDYFSVFYNQQEAATHYFNGFTFDTYPYGNSQASGGGGQLLFILIDPEFNTISMRNWSPYFEASGDPSAVDPTAFATNPANLPVRQFTFNFNARFP